MNDVLDEILNLDALAKKNMDAAIEKNEQFKNSINLKKQSIINSFLEDVNSKLEVIEKDELKKFEKEADSLKKANLAILENLQEIYHENFNNWANEIVSRILK